MEKNIPQWLKEYNLAPIEWEGSIVYVGVLPANLLESNEGQIEGLPRNPRSWTRKELESLKKSIRETPELTAARGCIVYPIPNKKAVVTLGGNMRLAAIKELRKEDVPVAVYPEGTPKSKLKEIVGKDNGTFGEWDFDALANEWDDLPLTDWGVPAWETEEQVSPDDFGEDFTLNADPKSKFQQTTFTLSDEQTEVLKNAIKDAQSLEEFKYMETFGNDNKNGNALYLILSQWAEQRK